MIILSAEVCEQAFRKVGFSGFSLHQPELASEPQSPEDAPFWEDFLRSPPAVLMDWVKD